MKTKSLLHISCLIELATGIALLIVPNLVASILLGSALNTTGEAVTRVGGFGLLSLGIACWPRGETLDIQPLLGLTLYNLGAGCLLSYLRISGDFTSIFLLPAGILHLILFLLFARSAFSRTP